MRNFNYFGKIKPLYYLKYKEWLIAFALLIAGFSLEQGMENYTDIAFYDETLYLERGLSIAADGIPPPEKSPLYSLWYTLLSPFNESTVALYYNQIKLSYILPAILLFFALRAYRVTLLGSSLLAFIFMISWANLHPTPRPMSFAILLFFTALILLERVKTLPRYILFSALAALIISYVRPEFLLSALLLALLYPLILLLHKRQIDPRKTLRDLIATTIAASILIGIAGVPFNGESNRSFFAFSQHYSLNNMAAGKHNGLNPWFDYKQITADSFGTANNIQNAFLNNPDEFIHHLWTNLKNYPNEFSKISHRLPIGPTQNVMAPWWETLILVAIIMVYAARFHFNSNYYKPSKSDINLAIIVAAFLLPSIISAIIIYPREHYLSFHFVTGIFLLGILFFRERIQSKDTNNSILTLSLLILALVPTLYSHGLVAKIQYPQQPRLAVINHINKLAIKKPVYMLEIEGGYNVYLTNNYHRIASYNKTESFDKFIKNTGVNMIVYNHSLNNDSRFKNDPQWNYFVNNFSEQGFAAQKINGTKDILLIHNSLLK